MFTPNHHNRSRKNSIRSRKFAAGRPGATGLILAAALAVAGLGTVDGVRAAQTTATFNGTGTLWSTATNWTPNVEPLGSTYNVVDDQSGASGNTPLDINGVSTTIGNFSLGSTAVMYNSGTSVETLSIDTAASGTGSIISGEIYGGLLSYESGTGAGIILNIGAGNSSTATTTISGLLTQNVELIIDQPTGTVTLSNTGNTYTGGTTISSGTVSISSAGNIGSGAITFGGGTLDYTGATPATLTNAITMSGNGTIDAGAQALTLSNSITNTIGTLTLQNGGIFLSGTNNVLFSGGTLQVDNGVGDTTVDFAAATNLPSSSAGITLDMGELAYTGGTAATVVNAITDTAGTVNVIDAGAQSLTLNNSITNTIGLLTLQNGGIVLSGTNNVLFSGGTLQVDNGVGDTTVDFAAATNLPSTGAGITLDMGELAYTGGTATTVVNAITDTAGTVNVIDADTQSLTLNNSITNTIGTLTLQNGGIVLSGTNNVLFSGGTLQVGNGTAGSTLDFTAATNLPSSSAGITLDRGTLAYTGGTSATVVNAITDAAGTDNVIDAGTQTLTLSNSIINTTGTLTLQNGTLVLGGTNNILFSGGTLQVGNGLAGSTLDFAAATNLPSSGAGITLDLGTLAYTGSTSATVVNAITDTGSTNNTIDANALSGGKTLTLNGAITNGTGTLTLQNGTLVLGSTSNSTDFNTGTLQVGNGLGTSIVKFNSTANLPFSTVQIVLNDGQLQYTGTSNVTVANNITLNAGTNNINTGGVTMFYTGVLSGTASLDVVNSSATAGALVLSNAETYSGSTTVGSASYTGAVTLTLADGGTLSSSTDLIVDANGTFNINNGLGQTVNSLSGAAGGKIFLSSGSLVVSNGDGNTFAGVISGGGGDTFTFDGNDSGTLTFTGANTYTGGTIVNGGTLILGSGGSITDGSNVTVNAGTFEVDNSINQTLGTLSGAGALTVNGSNGGTLNITGSLASYTGLTTIENSGTLGILLAGDLPSTDGFDFSNSGRLNLFDGGTTTLGPINLGTSGTDVIDGGGATNTVILGGDITGSGTAVLQLQDATFQLAPTNPTGNNSGFTAKTLQIGDGSDTTVVQFATGNSLDLPAATVGIALDQGTFQYTGAAPVIVGDNISVSGSNNNVINAGGLTGLSGLLLQGNLSGAGNLEMTNGNIGLSGTNSGFTGTLDLNNTKGSVAVALTSSTAITGGGITFDGGTLVNASLGTLTFATNPIIVDNKGGTIDTDGQLTNFNGAISGTGPLALTSSIANSGIISINNVNTGFTGATTISNGVVVQLGTSTALGSGGAGNTITINNTIAGNNGTVQFGASGLNIANNLTLAGNGTIDANSNTGTYSGVISGAGALAVVDSVGGGSVTLTAAESNTGGTTVGDGTHAVTLNIGNGTTGSLASGGNLTLNVGATVNVNNNTGGQTVGVLTGAAGTSIDLTASTDNLTVDNGGSFAGVISGNGGLTLTGGGLTLSGTNNYTGGTSITGGTLDVTGSLAATGNVTVTGGTFEVAVGGGNTLNIANLNGNSGSTLNLASGTLEVTPSTEDVYAGTVIGSGGLTVNGTGGSLDLTGDLAAFNGAFEATNSGSLYIGGSSRLTTLATFNINNQQTLGVTYTNLNDNAVIFSGTGGELQVTGTSGSSGSLAAITLGGADVIDAGGAANTLNLNGNITGTTVGEILQLQNGIFTLNPASNNAGFNTGTLQIGDGADFSEVAFTGAGVNSDLPTAAVGITLDKGILAYTGVNATTSIGSEITITGTTGNTINAGVTNLTLSGGFTGSGDVTLTGNGSSGGEITLTGDSGAGGTNFTGNTTIDGGITVNFQNNTDNNFGNFGTGSVTLAAAGDTLQFGANNINLGNNINVNAAGFLDLGGTGNSENISGNMAINSLLTVENPSGTSGTLTLFGNNSGAGGVTVAGSSIIVNFQNATNFGTGMVTLAAANDVMQFGQNNITVSNALALNSTGGTIDANDFSNETWSGVISGNDLTVESSGPNPGTLTLTNVNTYNGTTTISGVNTTLALAGNGSIAASSGVDIASSGASLNISGITSAGTSITSLSGVTGTTVALGAKTLTITNGNATAGNNFAGVIGGTGGLTIAGGTETLSGNNNYTGATNINTGGTLDVTGTLYNSGVTATSNVNLDGGTFDVGNSFAIGNLNGVDGSVLNIGATDILTVQTTQVDIYGGSLTGGGTLTVNGAGGGSLNLTGDLSAFTGALESTQGGDLLISGTSQLNSSATLFVTANHTIQLAYGNLNGNDVTFTGNTGTGGLLSVTGPSGSSGTLGAIDITDVSGTTLNTIDGDGIPNTLTLGAITSGGAGNTLVLQNGIFNLGNNTAFTLGTLQIGNGTNLAAIAEFAAQNDIPASTVALVLNNGDMKFAGSGLNLDNTSITVDAAGGSFDINGQTGSQVSGNIAINGLLTLENSVTGGGGTLILSGNNSGGGGVNVDSGLTVNFQNTTSATSNFGTGTVTLAAAGDTLQYGVGGITVSNALQVNAAGSIDVDGNTGTWSGPISDTGALTLNDSTGGGTGKLILTGNNTNLTGGVTLENGLIVNFQNTVSDLSNFGTDSVTIASTGGTLQYGADNLTVGNNLVMNGAGAIDVDGNTGTWSGVISGSGVLTLTTSIANTGELFLTGDNSALGGGVKVEGGLLVNFNNNNALGASTVTIATTGGTLQYGANGVTIADALNMNGAGTIDVAGNNNETWSGPISGAGALTLNTSVDGGKLFLSGNNSGLSGGVTVENGLTVNFDNTVSNTSNFGTGTVTFGTNGGTLQYGANNITVSNALAVSNAGIIDAAGNTGTWSGVISGGSLLTLYSSVANAGTLILTGFNTYTAGTDVTNGVIAVAGNDIDGISNAFGIGTLAVTGSTVDSINSYNLSQGDLLATARGQTIDLGGYTQDAASTLNFVAFGRPVVGQSTSGTYDSLAVNNLPGPLFAVQLNGTLNLNFSTVSNANFRPADFDTYTLVTATGTITGTAGAGTVGHTSVEHGGSTYGTGWLAINPTSTNLDLNYYETDPSIINTSNTETVTIQTLFAPDAPTPNEQSVAAYIDQYVNPSNTNVPPGIKTGLANLSLQSPGEIALLLNALTPQAYAGLADEAFQNSTFLNQEIYQQTQNAFDSSGFNTSGLTILKTSDQNPFAISMQSQMQSAKQQAINSLAYLDSDSGYSSDSGYNQSGGLSGFILGTITIDQQAGNNGLYSQRDTTGGVLAGLDYRLNRNLVVGALFNWGYTGGTVDNFNSGQENNSYTPGLFAGYTNHQFYADALVSYTYNTYRIDRNIPIPGSASVATGEPTANQYDAALLAGYNVVDFNGLKLGPAAGVGFTQMNISGFNETGSPFDLSVSKQHADSLRTLLGAQGQYTFHIQQSPLPITLNADAFWQHECLNSARGITSSFSQVSGGQFLYNTPETSRNSALLGLGASGYLAHGVSLFVNYQTQIGGKSQFAQTVMAGVAVSF